MISRDTSFLYLYVLCLSLRAAVSVDVTHCYWPSGATDFGGTPCDPENGGICCGVDHGKLDLEHEVDMCYSTSETDHGYS